MLKTDNNKKAKIVQPSTQGAGGSGAAIMFDLKRVGNKKAAERAA